MVEKVYVTVTTKPLASAISEGLPVMTAGMNVIELDDQAAVMVRRALQLIEQEAGHGAS